MTLLRHALPSVVATVLAAWTSAAAAHGDTTNTRELKIGTLAPGIYTIRHADPTDDFPDGNTTVVVGEREVLVVDTCYLPSSADADIARIRQWTDKPVRWVLNTHWHNDHIGGNHRYRLAWPGVQIVGHEETRRMIDARVRSYVRRFVSADSVFGKQRDALRATVEKGVDAKGAVVNAVGRQAAAESLKRLEHAVAQFRDIGIDPPNVTLTTELIDRNGSGITLEEVQKAVDLTEVRKAFAGDDADNKEFFDASMSSLVRAVYWEARAR